MDTTANLIPVAAADADGFAARWASDLKTSIVYPTDAHEFLGTAPVGTVIEFWDELYKRRSSGQWCELETILEGNEFMPSEHDETSAERLAAMAYDHTQPITVLKIGRG